MMKLSSIFLLSLPLIAYGFFFSLLASHRKIPLWSYWAGTLASFIPWIVVIFILLVAVQFLPAKLQQAGAMSALFPMICVLGAAMICPVVSLFLRSDLALAVRVKWFALVSSIPASIVLVFLLFVFISDSRKS